MPQLGTRVRTRALMSLVLAKTLSTESYLLTTAYNSASPAACQTALCVAATVANVNTPLRPLRFVA